MRNALRVAVTIAIALGVAPSVHAQEKRDPSQNASGGASAVVRPYERDPAASRVLFDRLDKNKDGYLTGNELTGPDAQGANWISVDRNGDGRIARSEFTVISVGAGSASAGATAPR